MSLDTSLWKKYDASYRLLHRVYAIVPQNKILRITVRVIDKIIHCELQIAERRCSDGPNLVSLPLELLFLVLLELDYEDLYFARQTCRALYKACRSHCVLTHLFKEYSGTYTLPIYTPKPFHAYSASQLETMMSKFHRSHRFFTQYKVRYKTPPSRVIRRSAETLASYVLIDGGRWLLFSDALNQGNVLYFDLDIKSYDQELEATVLIQNDEQCAPVTYMNAWVDHSCSDFQFNLATTYATYLDDSESTNAHPPQPQTTIWRVIESEGSTLTVTKVTTFVIEPPFHENTCLLGSMFAYWMGPNLLEVIDFEAPNTEDDSFLMSSLVAVSPRSTWALMQLLPDRKVVVLRPDTLAIYHIPHPKLSPAIGTVPLPNEETPFLTYNPYPDEEFIRSLSQLQVTYMGAFQLTLASTDMIYALTKDLTNKVWVKDLIYCPGSTQDSYILAPHGSLFRRQHKGHRNSYMYLCAFLCRRLRRNPLDPDGLTPNVVIPPQLDDWSGRVVYAFDTGDLVITDL